MSGNIRNMTEGKPGKLILSFALPLMFGNIFQQLYTVMDTLIVGRALGVNALAALGAADWLNWMILGIITGFTQGFSILISQEFGARNMERLRKVIGNSIVLAISCSVLLLAGSELIAHPVLIFLDTPEDVLPISLTYLRIMFAGAPIVMAYNMLASILRALGDGKTPLKAMLIASVVNIVLDLFFVIVLKTGVGGAAIATLIAQVLASVICLRAILRTDILKLEQKHFKPDASLCRKLIYLGTPMAAQNTIIAVGGLIVQSIVNGYGVLFIAGFTATNKLYGILEIAATSYGYSMTTYVGQNLGAGNWERIRRGVHSAALIAFVTSLVISVSMLLFGRFLVGSFITGTPEETLAATNIAYHYLTIMSLLLSILYILHLYRAALQGMGNTLMPMVSGIAEFIMRTLAALLLPRMIGQDGIFYAEVLAWVGADIILLAAYYRIMAKHRHKENVLLPEVLDD